MQVVLADVQPEIRSLITELTEQIVANPIVLDHSRFHEHVSRISEATAAATRERLNITRAELHGAPHDIYEIRHFLTTEEFRGIFRPYYPENTDPRFHVNPRLDYTHKALEDSCPAIFSLETSSPFGNENRQVITVEKQPWLFGPLSQLFLSNSGRFFDSHGVSVDGSAVSVSFDSMRQELTWSEVYGSNYPTALMQTAILVSKYREGPQDHLPSSVVFTSVLAQACNQDVILSPLFKHDFYVDKNKIPRSHTLPHVLSVVVQEGICKELPTSKRFQQYRINSRLRGRARLGMPIRDLRDDAMGYGELIIEKVALPFIKHRPEGKAFLDYADVVPNICSNQSLGTMLDKANEAILGNDWLRCRRTEHSDIHPI